MIRILTTLILISGLTLPSMGLSAPSRIKELADVRGVRENMLIGYGLVVGLSGTGDTQQVLFTNQSISGMLGRLGVRVSPMDIRSRNVAAVMVTAQLPAFVRSGAKLDVNVGSIGNARSLAGGTLLMTPLKGPDGQVYALGQGSVQAGGFSAGSSQGASIQKNQPTSGRVPGGGIVERSVLPNLNAGRLYMDLKEPDFTTASRMVKALNDYIGTDDVARAVDAAAIEITVPADKADNVVAFLGELETLRVEADRRGRIVINERTGTVVAGADVVIRPVAVAHGNLEVSITPQNFVSQPNAFSQGGQTVAGSVNDINTREEVNPVIAVPGATNIQGLVTALNTLGVSARDLITILQAMKSAGAIDADLEVM
ncbi:MAG: flagellar biosynthesis protein FlgA [Myxococcales bacterium]|nr:flagellar biosynthesis protein FlgA [Myxococcales bacterium]|tara:strand:+ start:1147 stop:2256 length:1110 start_codon:yes stop_codon:yes gene_type:complete